MWKRSRNLSELSSSSVTLFFHWLKAKWNGNGGKLSFCLMVWEAASDWSKQYFSSTTQREEKASRGCVILYTFRRKVVDNLLCLCNWNCKIHISHIVNRPHWNLLAHHNNLLGSSITNSADMLDKKVGSAGNRDFGIVLLSASPGNCLGLPNSFRPLRIHVELTSLLLSLPCSKKYQNIIKSPTHPDPKNRKEWQKHQNYKKNWRTAHTTKLSISFIHVGTGTIMVHII